LRQNDTVDKSLIDKKTKDFQKVLVPILKPENFGEHMAIDDKNIGGEGYTIISNKKTQKIAVMIMSTKHKIIEDVLHKIPRKIRWNVLSLSRDLAESYCWVGRTCFPKSVQIADKFHIIKLALEAVSDVRIRHRQEALSDNKANKTFSNGDSLRQLLARSRHLLFKFDSEWSPSQKERADILFKEFPEIKKAYSSILGFRAFYNTKIGFVDKASAALSRWYAKIDKSDIPEIKTFANTVKSNHGSILEYFYEVHTNAFAESLNAKIQRFIHSNFGIHNRHFFRFRLAKIFS